MCSRSRLRLRSQADPDCDHSLVIQAPVFVVIDAIDADVEVNETPIVFSVRRLAIASQGRSANVARGPREMGFVIVAHAVFVLESVIVRAFRAPLNVATTAQML